MKYYYIYVIELSNKNYYIGSTGDLEQRIEDHLSGRVDSTKNFRPLKL